MNRFLSLALLAAVSCKAIFAHNIDQALAFQEKRQVNLSTGDSGTTPSSSTNAQTSQITSVTIITTASTVFITPTSSVFVTTSYSTRPPSTTTAATSESFSQVISSSVQLTTYTYITTHDGTTEVATATGETTIPVTTSAKVTPTALAAGQDGSSSGLTESSKKIIGGVVGGVGGALLIGALAFTAWRIWGKKNKNMHDEDMYDPNMNTEKLSNSTGDNTPFHSTLDQYHRPVNTASNF